MLAVLKVNSPSVFLFSKTTNVDIYDHGNATFNASNEERNPSNEEKILDTSLLCHLCHSPEFVTAYFGGRII